MISENAKRVLEARYLRRNSDRGIAESPGQFFERVARAVSEAEMINGTPGRYVLAGAVIACSRHSTFFSIHPR